MFTYLVCCTVLSVYVILDDIQNYGHQFYTYRVYWKNIIAMVLVIFFCIWFLLPSKIYFTFKYLRKRETEVVIYRTKGEKE